MARLNTDALLLRAALVVSALLLALRAHLARSVGFGDAEALYACYALHPQPAYLDHPGLVGAVARFIGSGGAPTPLAAHRLTTIASTLVPWLGFAAARAWGAPRRRALVAFFALALLPELSLGLFAMTPDLPLAVLWISTLGAAGAALRSRPGSGTALVGTVLAGLTAGLAVHAKATGALLVASLVLTYTSKSGRAHLRTAAPYFALAVVVVLLAPLVLWEKSEGWPMLRHRFVATQGRSGLSLRNAGALVGGQLLYVTPPFLLGAYRVLRALARRADPLSRLLLLSFAVPAAALIPLCLWSRVAEPHWVAPMYLALALAAAVVEVETRALAVACAVIGVLGVAVAFTVVTTPLLPRLAGASYVPKYDLVNDLYVWKTFADTVREELDAAEDQSARPVVVGPHWTICAQLHAALGSRALVGCQSKEGDDFETWLPAERWRREKTLLFVTDDRFEVNPAERFPDRDVVSVRSARVYRGGRVVRTLRVSRLELHGVARR